MRQLFCFGCGAYRPCEKDHPIPRRCSGTLTIPLCRGCHDQLDRMLLADWDTSVMVRDALTAFTELPTGSRLLMLKLLRIMTDAAVRGELEIEVDGRPRWKDLDRHFFTEDDPKDWREAYRLLAKELRRRGSATAVDAADAYCHVAEQLEDLCDKAPIGRASTFARWRSGS